jgi:hypothetical protein
MNTLFRILSFLLLVITTVLVISNCSKEENPVIPIIPENPELNLLFPVGGESILANTSTKIKWSSTKVDSISIHLSTNNGIDWVELVSSVSADSSEWDWMTPDIHSDSCKIKITAKSTSLNDESKSNFSINVDFTINLLTPNGGEVWESRTDYLITWSSENYDYITIEYTSDNGINWDTVAFNVATSAREYLWETHYQPSDEYRIKLSFVRYPTINDESENNFTIIVAPRITESLSFYPHAIGNKWIYNTVYLEWGYDRDTTYTVLEVIDVQIEGRNKVIKLKEFSDYHNWWNKLEYYDDELDTLTGIVTRTGQYRNSGIWLDLAAGAGDILYFEELYNFTVRMVAELNEMILGYQTYSKVYERSHYYYGIQYKFSKSFGRSHYSEWVDLWGLVEKTLKGCIIDGVVYGDTTTVAGN